MNGNNGVSYKLNEIFIRLFDINLNSLDNELFGKNLLGDKFCFEPVDLLCLYMEIEKEFEIDIPQRYIIDNKFTTINNIKEIINIQLEENKVLISNVF